MTRRTFELFEEIFVIGEVNQCFLRLFWSDRVVHRASSAFRQSCKQARVLVQTFTFDTAITNYLKTENANAHQPTNPGLTTTRRVIKLDSAHVDPIKMSVFFRTVLSRACQGWRRGHAAQQKARYYVKPKKKGIGGSTQAWITLSGVVVLITGGVIYYLGERLN